MKKLIPMLSKVLLILLLVVSSTSTGFLGDFRDDLKFTDTASDASANCSISTATGTAWECAANGGTWGGGGGGTTTVIVEVPVEVTCPSGTTKIGSGTSAYCQKVQIVTQNVYVKQTETKYVQSGDYVGLEKILESIGTQYGGTGDRGDGQFSDDKGTHSNGWNLDGSGAGKTNNFVNVTNIPDNGSINEIGDSWSPAFLISQGKVQLPIPEPLSNTSIESQKWNSDLNVYKASLSDTEVIIYEVKDLATLETIQASADGLSTLFTKDSMGGYSYTSMFTRVDKDGIANLDKLKIKSGGYYIIGTKYIDYPSANAEAKGKNVSVDSVLKDYTSYTFTPISLSFTSDLGYLPIYNNLLSQVNESMLLVGNRKVNHKLANLKYQSYKSMKVPSAYSNHGNLTLVASTSGGIQLIDGSMQPIAITDTTGLMNTCKANDILEHNGNFYIATDQGVLFLNGQTKQLAKTSATSPTNDLDIYSDNLYLITETTLTHYFIDGTELIKSTKEYNLATMFKNPANKAGRIEVIGDMLTVSSKDTGSGSEVIILSTL